MIQSRTTTTDTLTRAYPNYNRGAREFPAPAWCSLFKKRNRLDKPRRIVGKGNAGVKTMPTFSSSTRTEGLPYIRIKYVYRVFEDSVATGRQGRVLDRMLRRCGISLLRFGDGEAASLQKENLFLRHHEALPRCTAYIAAVFAFGALRPRDDLRRPESVWTISAANR